MDNLEKKFQRLDLTGYETKVLLSIIRFGELDAGNVAKKSKVPQPKVYEIMNRLHEKGYVDIIPVGRKKVYKIRSKSTIKSLISREIDKINEDGLFMLQLVDDLYENEVSSSIPLYGVGGDDAVQETLLQLVASAKESIDCFLPPAHVTPELMTLLESKTPAFQATFIFASESDAVRKKEMIKPFQTFKLKSPAFEIIKGLIPLLRNNIGVDHHKSYSYNIIEKMIMGLKENFGLAIFDGKRSFFKIPLPVDLSVAIVSTVPDLLEFHINGFNQILKSSILVN
ncbi:MAG: TrmB family transcriptional regulator [Promethearchaeota archaeon]